MPGPAPWVNSPFCKCGTPQTNSTTSKPRCSSPLESSSNLPCSEDIRWTSSCLCSSINALNLNITRARRWGLIAAQAGCGVSVLQTGLHLPGARIVDRAGDGASARDALAVDELADRARHGVFLSQCVDAMMPHAGTRRHWTKVSLIPWYELASCPHRLPIKVKSKLE